MTLAENAVERIIEDLSDRCGIGDEWSEIPDVMKESIKQTWIDIIEEEELRNYKEIMGD